MHTVSRDLTEKFKRSVTFLKSASTDKTFNEFMILFLLTELSPLCFKNNETQTSLSCSAPLINPTVCYFQNSFTLYNRKVEDMIKIQMFLRQIQFCVASTALLDRPHLALIILNFLDV